MIIADALVLLLTWKKTFEEYRAVRKFPRFASFHTLLLRDGTIYFLWVLPSPPCTVEIDYFTKASPSIEFVSADTRVDGASIVRPLIPRLY